MQKEDRIYKTKEVRCIYPLARCIFTNKWLFGKKCTKVYLYGGRMEYTYTYRKYATTENLAFYLLSS